MRYRTRDGTLEKYTPSGDYVVVKFARWAFEKFDNLRDKLGTQMQAVGEVMSIGKNYKEAMQKSIRSLEIGCYGLGFAKDYNNKSLDELMILLTHPSSERQFIMYEALRKGAKVGDLYRRTYIKPWFISQMKELVELEELILKYKWDELPDEILIKAKKDGFADKYLSQLMHVPEKDVRERRLALGIKHAFQAVPVSGVENASYYYSTFNGDDEVQVSSRKKIMVLVGGPNRIGQGIEFDYCCVHAAFAIKEAGYESIMINCNPETVSTDYDLREKKFPHFGVKEAVFPFNMFPGVDPVLGPEMRSTGEVLGLADSYGLAFFKSQEATLASLPLEGTVLITIADRDKNKILEFSKNFMEMKFRIIATGGTKDFLEENGIECEYIRKVHEGMPNIVDAIVNGEIDLIINTPAGKTSEYDDSYIRKNAIKYKIPYITTTSAALSSTRGIKARRNGAYKVKSLQEYHLEIQEI
jgi:hypothetical protein